MTQPAADIQRLSPDKLLTVFSRSNLLVWFVLSLLLHAVIVVVFSVLPMLFDQYLGGEPPAAQTPAAATAGNGEDEQQPATTGDEAQAEGEDAETPAEEDADDRPAGDAAADGEEAADKSAVEEEISTMPEEGETPGAPDLEIELD